MAAAAVTGQCPESRSSSSGSRRFDNPAASTQARILGKFSDKSVGCQISCGNCAAKYAACWPVPLPISSTKPERGKTSFSTAKIGSLLRSQDGEDCFKDYSSSFRIPQSLRELLQRLSSNCSSLSRVFNSPRCVSHFEQRSNFGQRKVHLLRPLDEPQPRHVFVIVQAYATDTPDAWE